MHSWLLDYGSISSPCKMSIMLNFSKTYISHYFFKNIFSCNLIDMTYAPHKICLTNISIPSDCAVKGVWADSRKSWKYSTRRQNCKYCPIMSGYLVEMGRWDCQECNKSLYTQIFIEFNAHNFPTDLSEHSIFTMLRLRLLHLW